MGADQTLVTSTEQKNETTNNAQDVDDRSSRSEHLQAISNVLQRNEDETGLCGGTFALNNEKRSQDSDEKQSLDLLNSEFLNFTAKKYMTYYNVPNTKKIPFRVEYIPSDGKLNIVMPVKFMGPNKVNIPSVGNGIESKEPTPEFKKAYMSSVNRMWNSHKYQLYLDGVNLDKNESCDSWAKLKPVEVNVSLENHSDNESKDDDKFYMIFSIPNTLKDKTSEDKTSKNETSEDKTSKNETSEDKTLKNETSKDKASKNGLALSSMTLSSAVFFTEKAFDNRQADINGSGKQNTFAHEFGHQIGLGDEYAVNNFSIPEYTATVKCDGDICDEEKSDEMEIYPVYKEPELKVYERTESNRFYTFSKDGALFNHEGVDYAAVKMTFEGGKTGYILKRVDTNEELEFPLEGLKIGKPDPATDTNGEPHKAVYFHDRILVSEKPGLRKYDLEKFWENHTEIYHNSNRYKVEKRCDVDQNNFYFLVDENGNRKIEFLDGMYTTHTKMVEEVFGEKYALENATKFNAKDFGDLASQFGNNDYLMNEGNNIMPHHYITFVYGMVAAIQKKYPEVPSQKAPNMEGDWIIR